MIVYSKIKIDICTLLTNVHQGHVGLPTFYTVVQMFVKIKHYKKT